MAGKNVKVKGADALKARIAKWKKNAQGAANAALYQWALMAGGENAGRPGLRERGRARQRSRSRRIAAD